ncbi:Hypothetical predicted protein [Octopus vulgaris]|uniref:Uncharacterized protein n=1 Tax=Octopus vulgaris TaxID=6645 RepID=A0AA36BPJ7_OCTVU|nr:Hypothetical predicted protein [Octopus vulgaris]
MIFEVSLREVKKLDKISDRSIARIKICNSSKKQKGAEIHDEVRRTVLPPNGRGLDNYNVQYFNRSQQQYKLHYFDIALTKCDKFVLLFEFRLLFQFGLLAKQVSEDSRTTLTNERQYIICESFEAYTGIIADAFELPYKYDITEELLTGQSSEEHVQLQSSVQCYKNKYHLGERAWLTQVACKPYGVMLIRFDTRLYRVLDIINCNTAKLFSNICRWNCNIDRVNILHT